jgi:LacI family transcriptional regulator
LGQAVQPGGILQRGHVTLVDQRLPPLDGVLELRLKGFRSELRAAGVAEADVTVLFGDFHTESGYTLTRSILDSDDVPTALFCGNDRMALGAYLAILERGLRIAEDVSVLGYDDQEELAAALHPPLATIRLPYCEMGQLAVQHPLAGDIATLPSRTYVPCTPVPRGSLGIPRTHELSRIPPVAARLPQDEVPG